jgi:hypothetical protein
MEQNTIVSTRLRRVPGKGCYLSIPMFTFPACEESLWCPGKVLVVLLTINFFL